MTLFPPSTAQKIRKVSVGMPFQKRSSALRASRETLAIWQKRLEEMERAGKNLTGDSKDKYLLYRRQLERQINKTKTVVHTLSTINEQKWENTRLHAEYMWKAMEDTWTYWKNLPKD